jgi:hypothetical protein
MKVRYFAGALALLALADPAQAKSFAWCQVNGAKYQAYLSGIVEIDDGPEAFRAVASGPFSQAFHDYVQGSLDPAASKPDCTKQDSLFYAKDYIDVLIKANPGFKFVKTGWRGGQAVSAEKGSKRGGSQSPADALRYRK